MINKKTFNDLQSASFDYLLTNTDITQLSPGGTARSIVDITNQHISEFYDTLDTDLSMAYLSTANGFFLDLIGQLFGVSRLQKQKINILRDDRAVKFYSKTAGTPLSKFIPSKTISQGTKVTTSNGETSYTVTRNEEFSATATEVFVSVESDAIGSTSNVGANVLTVHNLAQSSVGVTNIAPIALGRETETDSEFRNRISVSATAAETSNETAVRLAILSAPGVADVQIRPYLRGSGTFDVFVIPEGNRVPLQTMEIIQSRVATVVAYGVSFVIRELDYVPVRINAVARFTVGTLDGEKSFLLRQAEQGILRYLGNVRPGGELIMNQVRSIVIDTSPSIIDSDVVYLCINGRSQIIRNVSIEDDELLIPDEASSNPIVVRIQ